MFAIERPGPNREEITHNATGVSLDPTQGKTQYTFDQATARGIATIGIGDDGNEIGFGLIEDGVREVLPHGAHRRRPLPG